MTDTIQTKTTLKGWFVDGQIPVGSKYNDWITTMATVNKTTVSVGNVVSNVSTNATTGDIFELVLTGNINLNKPSNGINGKTIIWLMKQGNVGSNTITLDPSFIIPSSATNPLAFSSTVGKTDVFAATYLSDYDKWIVVSMIPGYSL